ncbi:hypothetical protein [Bradyrhizobium diversitatis]|uniref:Uncharacterized protein n=1 Tax=Bradyrhizobium diversitatis TaxID=2755406 RepID=A0ABS0P441_9BRAD|nr:hypothetical protein [Bradyrhizobium diversitatis]MBH5387842.1 hypothetical protein [Bradyrhizobium diversitatis]
MVIRSFSFDFEKALPDPPQADGPLPYRSWHSAVVIGGPFEGQLLASDRSRFIELRFPIDAGRVNSVAMPPTRVLPVLASTGLKTKKPASLRAFQGLAGFPATILDLSQPN